jgi:hypothetical protein
VNVTVPGGLSAVGGHCVAREVRHHLLDHLPHLDGVMIHVDRYGQAANVTIASDLVRTTTCRCTRTSDGIPRVLDHRAGTPSSASPQ